MRLITVALLFFYHATSYGNSQCDELSKMAGRIMDSRQSGVPINDMLSVLDEHGGNASSILRRWTIEAYKEPLYSTDENKRIAITEFQNEAMILCIEASE